jgi:hypothetical protein
MHFHNGRGRDYCLGFNMLPKDRRFAAILGQRLARQQNYLCRCVLLLLDIDFVRLGGMQSAPDRRFTCGSWLGILIVRYSTAAAPTTPP